GSVGMTKADIMAIEDDDERMRLIAENRNLF
ncbi:TPA: phage capsid protein, partial [Streptococcus pyogenes MGAS9901]|nr:phage capsid protein [Streptococcus pyogenes MGAS10029]HER5262483.1 phage capsid protein [Streptococcus pyogenes MGAS9901]HER5267822.1 phage capsid protein [Streptococcus pyogenes MGAS15049]